MDRPERGTSIGGLVVLVALILGVAAWMSFLRPQPVASIAAAHVRRLPSNPAALSGFRSDAWFLPDDDLLGFVEVPAGPFSMGSDPSIDALAFDNERWSDARAQGTVALPAFYIGRYEVTVAQFRAFVEATGFRVDDLALRAPPTHPVAAVLLARCARLRSMARDGAEGVAADAAATAPVAPRRLAGWSAERGGVGEGGTGDGRAALSMGERSHAGSGELRCGTHDTGGQLQLPGLPIRPL